MDIKEVIKSIRPVESGYFEKAQQRLDILTKPQGSLGFLEEIAKQYVAATRNVRPVLEKKKVFVFAADHGVTQEGVSLYPSEVTAQMVLNFMAGGAAVNVLSRHAGADMDVVDVGVDFDFEGRDGLIHEKVRRGTRNMARGPAMTRDELEAAMGVGLRLAQQSADSGVHLLATGEMGIGNTTAASAVTAALTGRPASDVTGRGTGLDDLALKRKTNVVARCLDLHSPDPGDAMDVLCKVGGFEIAAIAGLVLGAAENGVPVVVDGFISTAGALAAYKLAPPAIDYMFQGHRSVEPGHAFAVKAMGLRPILELDMRLGEGTGAVLAMNVIQAAVNLYNEMATFEDAGVSEAE